MLRHTHNQDGFTLIEAIVATFLFATVVTSILSVYMSTIKVNRKTNVIRSASENARFIEESMSKEIQNGQIDYYNPVSPCSTTLTSPSTTLGIVNVNGDHLCFYLGDNSGFSSSSGTNLWLIKNNLSAVRVNSSNVSVTNLNFYISPTFNPYTAGSHYQPRVTIVANITSSSGSQDSVTIPIQTTISIPVYDIAP